MMTPNDNATFVLGKSMKKFLLGLVIAAAISVPASSALAADLDVPLRPSDWTGFYVGAFGGGMYLDGTYDYVCNTCAPVLTVNDAEMSGTGYFGGVLAGYNYQIDSFVLGVEGDWAWGSEIASNDEIGEQTSMDFDNIATLRARAGVAFENTLIYATGGVAFVNTTFGTANFGGESVDESSWLTGWVIGVGMEHAFTDALTARLEYMYIGLPGETYSLTNSVPNTVDIDMDFDSIQMVRAGLAYKFNWW